MINKITEKDIEDAVDCLSNKSNSELLELLKFNTKILKENSIKDSSYRYKHAKMMIDVIAKTLKQRI